MKFLILFSLIGCVMFPPLLLAQAVEKDSVAVYVFLSESCPICQSSTLELQKIEEQVKNQPVKMVGIFPNSVLSTTETRKKFGKKYKLRFSLEADPRHETTLKYNATVTPEAVVINLRSGAIIYRGLIDNSYVAIGKRRQVVTEHYLRDALNAYTAKKEITLTRTTPVGCFIQMQSN